MPDDICEVISCTVLTLSLYAIVIILCIIALKQFIELVLLIHLLRKRRQPNIDTAVELTSIYEQNDD